MVYNGVTKQALYLYGTKKEYRKGKRLVEREEQLLREAIKGESEYLFYNNILPKLDYKGVYAAVSNLVNDIFRESDCGVIREFYRIILLKIMYEDDPSQEEVLYDVREFLDVINKIETRLSRESN